MALERVCGLSSFNNVDKHANELFEECNPNTANSIFIPRSAKENESCSGQHETITLGFRYEGGIILCADSLATNGESNDMATIIEVNKNILGTIDGCAADCTYWYRALSRECRLYELSNEHCMPVKTASRMLSNMAYRFEGMDLCLGMMLASFDAVDGAKLIHINSKGANQEVNCLVLGSGEEYATGFLERFYKWDMQNDEAYNLALRTIYQTYQMDLNMDKIVNLYHIRKDGWARVTSKTFKELDALYADVNCDPYSGFKYPFHNNL